MEVWVDNFGTYWRKASGKWVRSTTMSSTVTPKSNGVTPVTPAPTPAPPESEPEQQAPTPSVPAPETPTPVIVSEGVSWWYDDGPPGTILGSKPGDFYIDMISGVMYTLR